MNKSEIENLLDSAVNWARRVMDPPHEGSNSGRATPAEIAILPAILQEIRQLIPIAKKSRPIE